MGTRVLLCVDAHLATTTLLTRVRRSFERQGLELEVFDRALPDLPLDTLHDAHNTASHTRPDLIVGLGGGSTLDLAKLTALLSRHGGPIEQYYGENLVPGPVTPVIAVPTTAGTGSEVSPVAVVSDPRFELKIGVSSPHLIPACAVCDPALTDGCPATVTAHAGIDALAHAIEAYTAVSRDAKLDHTALQRVFLGKNVLSDQFALAAIRRIGGSLLTAVSNGSDRSARDEMALGSLLAGFAFAAAGTSIAHALQYPVGVRTHTPHGLGVGLLLPYGMAFNRSVRLAELAAIGDALASSPPALEEPEEAASAAIDVVADLCRAVGIPATLADIGLRLDELPAIATQAMQVRRLLDNNPRPIDQPSALAVLEAAWHGDCSLLESIPLRPERASH
jgi:alcohol dehydrogenase class IV